jgi:hypothetical protein
MVPGTTSLLLLRLLLQLRRYSSLILFFKHIKFVMNIITFTFLMFNAFLFVYQGFFTINKFFFNILNKYQRIISVGI